MTPDEGDRLTAAIKIGVRAGFDEAEDLDAVLLAGSLARVLAQVVAKEVSERKGAAPVARSADDGPPIMRECGIWSQPVAESGFYTRGSTVTYHGTLWTCQTSGTHSAPGTDGN